MSRIIHPKLKNMTKEEKKAWKEKMAYYQANNFQRDAINKVNDGRGWMF